MWDVINRLEGGDKEVMLQEQARIESEIKGIYEKYNKNVNLLEVLGAGGSLLKDLWR